MMSLKRSSCTPRTMPCERAGSCTINLVMGRMLKWIRDTMSDRRLGTKTGDLHTHTGTDLTVHIAPDIYLINVMILQRRHPLVLGRDFSQTDSLPQV